MFKVSPSLTLLPDKAQAYVIDVVKTILVNFLILGVLMFSTIKQNWKRHLQNTKKVWTRKEKRKKLQQRPLIMSSKRCYRKELKDWRR